MKLSVKWSIIGFLLPIIGIFIGKIYLKKDECFARSIRRGSAMSTIVLVLVGFFLVYLWAMGVIFK